MMEEHSLRKVFLRLRRGFVPSAGDSSGERSACSLQPLPCLHPLARPTTFYHGDLLQYNVRTGSVLGLFVKSISTTRRHMPDFRRRECTSLYIQDQGSKWLTSRFPGLALSTALIGHRAHQVHYSRHRPQGPVGALLKAMLTCVPRPPSLSQRCTGRLTRGQKGHVRGVTSGSLTVR
jgi:hypothetical protein